MRQRSALEVATWLGDGEAGGGDGGAYRVCLLLRAETQMLVPRELTLVNPDRDSVSTALVNGISLFRERLSTVESKQGQGRGCSRIQIKKCAVLLDVLST